MGLGKIALAFSGGGYRASGFHLGTLECLHRLGLLDDVKLLSTVSGGTFTGAAYVLARADKKKFSDFSESFARALEQTNVIEQALDGLKASRELAGNASLICAAAQVYDDVLFHGAYFEDRLLKESNFDDIVFNATEFLYGLSFRFALSSTDAVIGNKYFPVPQAAARKMRLADITAASSCFPGGFEPILFPNHFRFKDGAIPEELTKTPFDKPVPLMDGGIYDNQGIASILLAYNRKDDFELFLISDTDQSGDEIYKDAGTLPNGIFKLGYALVVVKVTFWLSFISAVLLALSLLASPWEGVSSVFLKVVPLFTTACTAFGIWWGSNRIRDILKGLDEPDITNVLVKRFRQLFLPEILVFARRRVLSVAAMLFDIFLKRIRDLSRSAALALQNNPRPPEPPNHDRPDAPGDLDAQQRGSTRVVETRIVKIPGQGKLTPFKPAVGWLQPSKEMVAVTTLAKKVGTQLWFDSTGSEKPERIMRALRLSGEITLCASLLQHLLRDRQEEGGTPENPKFTPGLQEVYERARQYWLGELTARALKFE